MHVQVDRRSARLPRDPAADSSGLPRRIVTACRRFARRSPRAASATESQSRWRTRRSALEELASKRRAVSHAGAAELAAPGLPHRPRGKSRPALAVSQQLGVERDLRRRPESFRRRARFATSPRGQHEGPPRGQADDVGARNQRLRRCNRARPTMLDAVAERVRAIRGSRSALPSTPDRHLPGGIEAQPAHRAKEQPQRAPLLGERQKTIRSGRLLFAVASSPSANRGARHRVGAWRNALVGTGGRNVHQFGRGATASNGARVETAEEDLDQGARDLRRKDALGRARGSCRRSAPASV